MYKYNEFVLNWIHKRRMRELQIKPKVKLKLKLESKLIIKTRL